MLVRRPDTSGNPLTQTRPTVIPSTRNPGAFTGWGPKL
jgi:hypothetical protein